MVQVGKASSPARNVLQGPVCPGRLWAPRLPGHSHRGCSQVSGQPFPSVRKPHFGKADGISHLARSWKEGLGSWGAGPGTQHALTHSWAGSTFPGAESQGRRETPDNGLFSGGLAKHREISLDGHSNATGHLHLKAETVRDAEK